MKTRKNETHILIDGTSYLVPTTLPPLEAGFRWVGPFSGWECPADNSEMFPHGGGQTVSQYRVCGGAGGLGAHTSGTRLAVLADTSRPGGVAWYIEAPEGRLAHRIAGAISDAMRSGTMTKQQADALQCVRSDEVTDGIQAFADRAAQIDVSLIPFIDSEEMARSKVENNWERPFSILRANVAPTAVALFKESFLRAYKQLRAEKDRKNAEYRAARNAMHPASDEPQVVVFRHVSEEEDHSPAAANSVDV